METTNNVIPNPYLPKVSCCMVTQTKRYSHVRRAVKCFIDQTYSNRELVVICGDEEDGGKLRTYLKRLNEEFLSLPIRYFHVKWAPLG